MKTVVRIVFLLIVVGGVAYFMLNKADDKESTVNTVSKKAKKVKEVVSAEKIYDLIPHEELFDGDEVAQAQLAELKSRFEESFSDFATTLSEDNVKFVYCWLTTEVGISETRSQRMSKPFIKDLCEKYGVEFVDFSDLFIGKEPTEITHMPKDGHLNETGVELIAGRLAQIVKANQAHRSNLSFQAEDRPRYLGDLEPYEDRIVEGGKGIPYRLITNAAGLRMDREVRFDNTGARVLLMGDSGFYFPFVDNDETATHLLQEQFPQAEVVNVAGWAYTITDYLSQYEQAAKYIEPDIILLQSSGDDIADLYFTHQQRFSRDRDIKDFKPSETEKKFYEYLENK
jgi:hypothetical protein